MTDQHTDTPPAPDQVDTPSTPPDAGNAVEPIKGELVKESPLAAVERYINDAKAAVIEDPEDVSDAIVARILASPDAGTLFAESETIAARDILGVPLNVKSVRWMQSDFEEGNGIYVVLDATVREDGKNAVVTCGARSVMAQLFVAQKEGWLPADLEFRQSARPTKRGYFPLSLVAAPKAS